MAKKTERKTPEIAVESSSEWTVNRALQRERRGEDVRGLQRALIARGYACGRAGADGIFGDDTKKAVRAFQGSERLTVDGIAGRQTVTALGGTWKE